jgi:hypothetical protein
MACARASPNDVCSSIWFLDNLDLYKTVKPYHLTFTPENDVPRNNIQRKEVKDLLIRDLRDLRDFSGQISLDRNGFTVLNLENNLTPDDCEDREKLQKLFFDELESSLKSLFPHSCVAILQYRVSTHDSNTCL